ncbi:DUF3291 domain-containing protein [Catalinimonas niigatensis]|uniref:DUF3291 domain-containing protein n=1 Tax=Catalinimonas niigatensis TaxID=1397264 RepID=UPI002666A428|nr:DUF3291 domain-containing protein [Catalinimonas niigatensis]WPP52685.1 DUF3291 domain-containing protein [Catalinimonas niigatensis]
MKVNITSIALKSPFRFFPLSVYALNILKQLKSTHCVEMKKRGVWTKHYTMTLWKNEADLKAFAASGAHLEAMKNSRKIAKEIRTLTIDADTLPDWKTARSLLEKNGKVITYWLPKP